MIEQVFEDLLNGENVRANLISLKEQIKEEEGKEKVLQWEKQSEALQSFLRHEDAKCRKNAVMLLGTLRLQEAADKIWQAYETEEKLFVRSAYLSALEKLDITDRKEDLQAAYDKLSAMEFAEEEKKHRYEELKVLDRILRRLDGNKKHKFTGYDQETELLLLTNPRYREVTADQIKHGKADTMSLGVKVKTSHLREICGIRTYLEMLFLLPGAKSMEPSPLRIAEGLLDSKLVAWLEQIHEGGAPFYFRIELKGNMEADRGEFLRKTAARIEELSGRNLLNSTDNYEIEIRLIPNKSGRLMPFLKLYTIPMRRFSYRKNAISTSIHPAAAALLVQLASPYMKEKAQVLDPFCGVGTMLIERDMLIPAGDMYGTDIFGEAIIKARENAAAAGRAINFINRDYFDFTHEYRFDEIITNMPEKGKKTKEEQDQLYADFFEKSSSMLNSDGVIIMYSNESGFVKKQLRLRSDYHLINEYSIREKEGYYLFIIGTKR